MSKYIETLSIFVEEIVEKEIDICNNVQHLPCKGAYTACTHCIAYSKSPHNLNILKGILNESLHRNS